MPRMPRLSQVFVPEGPRVLRPLRGGRRATSSAAPTCSTRCCATTRSRPDLARDILICEQEGDRITHDLIHRLNNTFVTPIDREDIIALASALDDIVDFTEEVADYLGPLQDRGADGAGPAAGPHPARGHAPDRRGDAAAARLRATFDHYTVEIHRLENDGDRIVREAVASLFEGGIDPMVVIRWKDLFERLEEAIDACETRGQRPRRASSSRTPDPMASDIILVIVVGDGAGLRLHQRLPRHRQRRGHRDLDARGAAAHGRHASPRSSTSPARSSR